MLRSTAVGVALAALVTLSGCDGSSADPADSMSTWTPSAPTDSTSPSESATEAPTEPTLPKAAKQATESGARAFIKYYWDLVNYAQVTGDIRSLRATSGRTCEGCLNGIAAISDIYDAGGHAVGGENQIEITYSKEIDAQDDAIHAVEMLLDATNVKQTIVEADGTRRSTEVGTTEFLVYVIWTAKAWRVDVLDPQ